MTSAAGRGTTSVTSSAARRPNGRRACSFHAETSGRATPVYATAARAVEKARRLPAHSRQRATGQAVGDPQRAQSGGASRTSACRHCSQAIAPGREQAAQRRGSTRSSSHSLDGTAAPVTCLCQLCARSAPTRPRARRPLAFGRTPRRSDRARSARGSNGLAALRRSAPAGPPRAGQHESLSRPAPLGRPSRGDRGRTSSRETPVSPTDRGPPIPSRSNRPEADASTADAALAPDQTGPAIVHGG
jgi:hypothetical protein